MANLRYSSAEANGKKYLGGPLIGGTSGIYNLGASAVNSVFDEVTKAENVNRVQDYRCLYFQNNYTGQTIYAPSIVIVGMPSTDDFSIGLLSGKNVDATPISTETTIPSGISFQSIVPKTPINLIQGGNDVVLLPGEYVGFWLRREPKGTGSSGTQTVDLSFEIRFTA